MLICCRVTVLSSFSVLIQCFVVVQAEMEEIRDALVPEGEEPKSAVQIVAEVLRDPPKWHHQVNNPAIGPTTE